MSNDLVEGALLARGKVALAHWGRRWDRPGLADVVEIQISRRMTRSLGRALVGRGLIRISHHVARASPDAFLEVLCHEAAHVVIFERFARRARPHGPAWAGLMRAAGYEARTRVNPADLGIDWPKRRGGKRRSRYIYEHRCGHCGMRRRAHRAVRQWRCSRCYEAGREGRLEIVRWPA